MRVCCVSGGIWCGTIGLGIFTKSCRISSRIHSKVAHSTSNFPLNYLLVYDRYTSSHVLWSRCSLGRREDLIFWSEKVVLAAETALCSSSSIASFSGRSIFQTLSFHLHCHLTHPFLVFFDLCELNWSQNHPFWKDLLYRHFLTPSYLSRLTVGVINFNRNGKNWTLFDT